MATNTRVFYPQLALFATQNVSVTGAQTGVGVMAPISRVTDFTDGFNRTLTDIVVFGQLDPLDRVDLEAPTVNGSFTYYPTNGLNEKFIGLTVTSGTQPLVSCISGILTKETDEKNYYFLITQQGYDANGYIGDYSGVIALGNANITNYTLNLAVNELINSSVDLEGLNWATYADINGTNDIPAVNPINGFPITGVPFVLPAYTTDQVVGQVSALQYGQATISITGDFGFGPTSNNYNIQNATLTIPLSRTPINRLGNRYSFSRELDFPIIATFTVEAEITGVSSKNLANILCEGPQDAIIRIDKPFCANQTPEAAMLFFVRGAKVTSEDQSNSTTANSTISVTYEVALGSAQQTQKGIFISGSAS